MNCRICGSGNVKLIFSSHACPRSSHTFLEKEQNSMLTNIQVFTCEDCLITQLKDKFTEDYSDDYQRNTSFSESALAFMKKNIKFFEEALGSLGKKRLLEIGCGNGLFSKMLSEKGATMIAFEPSKAAATLARNNNIEVINDYFSPSKINQKFDGFVLRYVLEHIPEPLKFLREINSSLEEGALGLIELPNFQKMLDTSRYYEFFPEHQFYFTGTSLAYVLSKTGFELVKYYTVMNDEYLVAIVKKTSFDEKIDLLNRSVGRINQSLKKMVSEISSQGGKVAFWGASGAGVGIINYAGIKGEEIAYLFDSDENKQGLYTFGVPIKIVSPTILREEKHPDAIIIMSTTYEDEIKNDLLKKYNFQGKIGSIKGIPHWT